MFQKTESVSKQSLLPSLTFIDFHGELKIMCNVKIVSFICYLGNKEHIKM